MYFRVDVRGCYADVCVAYNKTSLGGIYIRLYIYLRR